MRLTPLDIRKQEFSRGLRGYEAEEVDAFLQMVSNQWEELLDESRRNSEEIRDLKTKLSHYEKVEEALQEALQTARDSSKKSIENAEQKAALLIERAEARADEIKREAEIERHQLKRETTKLSGRKSEIVARLRAFLMSEMELLASYEGDDPVGFIKLLPADKQRLDQDADTAAHEGHPSAARKSENPDGFGAADSASSATLDQSGRAASEEPQPTSSERASDEAPRPDEGATLPVESSEQDEASSEAATDDFDDEIPADVTAAEHARQKRTWYDTFEPDEAPTPTPREEGSAGDAPAREELEDDEDGSGWTTQTFVSGSADQAPEGEGSDSGEEADSDEETRASSEEIEKIRRILSDLD